MYSNKLAIAVKHNGRVLREHGDTVHLPFGSEYSLHFKNMNSVRALVRVSVDGQDATEGTSLIVPANGSVDLERFIKNGNLSSGHKFKFIERTSKIENGPRGIKAEDGLVRIEFEFEREPAKLKNPDYITPWFGKREEHHHHHYHRSYPDFSNVKLGGAAKGSAGDPTPSWTVTSTAADFGDGVASASFSAASNSISANMSQTLDSFSAPRAATKGVLRSSSASKISVQAAAPLLNDKGITVGGSKSDQQFVAGSWFPTDGVKHVMVLKLLGETSKGKVEKAVTVKTKQECPTCGTKNKHGTKFCRECGTGLEVV